MRAAVLLLGLVACSPSVAHAGDVEKGKAAFYGDRFHGRKTANGERYDKHAMTAAHKTLPFGTVVRVTNMKNGKSVEVRINDRGPYGKGRIIDLSRAAAKKLEMIRAGVVPVEVRIVSTPKRAGR